MKKHRSNNFYFILLSILLVIITFLFKQFLFTEDLLFNIYSEILSDKQLENILYNQKKTIWLNYLVMPIFSLLRISFVAFCLIVGNLFYSWEKVDSLKFNVFFRIALIGEFVLVLISYFKFGYFYFIKTDYTLQDLQQYYPLSYINFLDIENLQPWLVYPLQTINLFELTYFLVLVYGLNNLLKNKYWKSFEITAVSYGTGLVIWMGFVMFLTLNIS